MQLSKLTEAQLLDRAQIIYTNAVTVESIRKELELSGYDAKKIEEGKTFFEEASNIKKENDQKDLEVKQLSEEYKMKSAQLSDTYKAHRDALKRMFKNEATTYKALGLDIVMKTKSIDFINETDKLYSALLANEEVLEKIKMIRLNTDIINETKSLINEVALLRSRIFQLKAEAQNLTQTKKEKINDLKAKMNEIILVAEVALKGQDQMLEAFGVVVR
ncbi:hypothetical protein KMW28_12950 [Flammeovirga yaeyamensis]|uniref:Uncharacterized protein n=1 Tax=Flammeovirga yaeyamensis TaxID=367791 RepID=A0AAX1N338_9BACT|nr:hypothetical protein [Flammeovirga yaeyamensis]MBB3695921.1 chemotaxis protein histidine kinase CheA [Flammeovirga yaeyamensis]NMF34610.1 hypothetical protein [Flammeovirga yaeyamensis]QWG00560.1 hypothetical protein KMW28_12950 [Flammeovirga yaeyamensis]